MKKKSTFIAMRKLSYLIIASIILMTSCTKTPSAEFSANKTILEENEEVTFTNNSKHTSTSLWDFGDGNVFEQKSKSVKYGYQKSGDYIVTLKASTKRKSNSTSITIKVIPERYKFTGIIGNTAINFITGIDLSNIDIDGDNVGVPSSNGNVKITYGTKIGYLRQPIKNYFSIRIGQLEHPALSMPNDTAFTSLIKVGSYNYSVGATNGVLLSYFDANGVKWSTDLGSADQTGSFFYINSTELIRFTPEDYGLKYKAVINAKLYNSNGNMMQLTGGYMVGAFGY
jgi:PKD repeat protein